MGITSFFIEKGHPVPVTSLFILPVAVARQYDNK
jgi:hypothetical protein